MVPLKHIYMYINRYNDVYHPQSLKKNVLFSGGTSDCFFFSDGWGMVAIKKNGEAIPMGFLGNIPDCVMDEFSSALAWKIEETLQDVYFSEMVITSPYLVPFQDLVPILSNTWFLFDSYPLSHMRLKNHTMAGLDVLVLQGQSTRVAVLSFYHVLWVVCL